MGRHEWSEKAFPQNWAGIRLVPDTAALAAHGATPDGFFNLMDGYVQGKIADGVLSGLSNPEPGVYCAPFFDAAAGVLERLYALSEVLEENEVVRECAPDSLWTSPEEGTCPLIRTR